MKQNKTKTHIQMTLSQDVMVEQERTSDPASTGEVGGLASDPHMVDETMNFDSQGTVTKKIFSRYTKPPCHLLMIGPKHVCYIPNIQEFMLQGLQKLPSKGYSVQCLFSDSGLRVAHVVIWN